MFERRDGGGLALAALAVLWACSGEAPAGRGASAASEAPPEAEALPAPVSSPDTLPPEGALHPLEGTEWIVVELPGASPPPGGPHATLVLDREGSVIRGSTGCNTFDGSWEVAGTRLTLGLTSITGRQCDGALARLETDYLEALRRTGSFRLRGDVLELLGEAGVVARLEPRGTTGG
jgi:heat shock protein HslJ